MKLYEFLEKWPNKHATLLVKDDFGVIKPVKGISVAGKDKVYLDVSNPEALDYECPSHSLTVAEVRDIVEIADAIITKKSKKELLKMGEVEYYKTVLDEFNKMINRGK